MALTAAHKNRIWLGLLLVGTTLLLCAQSFYNGFPLVYSDSGTYLLHSYSLEPPIDRPIGYSFFIRLVTWQASSWPIVIAQSLILNLLIFFLAKAVLKDKKVWLFHLLTCIGLVAVSSLGWYTNQIMPDIFASALILVFFLFLQVDRLKIAPAILMGLLFFLFVFTHLSHVLLAAALIGLYALFTVVRKTEKTQKRGQFTRLSILTGIWLAAILVLMSNHAMHGLGFKLSRTSNLFLTARLSESGVLKMYLDDHCGETPNGPLCAQKENLPATQYDFLWQESNPMEQEGLDFLQADSVYQHLPKAILSQPKYLLPFLGNSIVGTGKQLTQLGMDDGPSYIFGEGTAPWWAIRLKPEVDSYLKARQNTVGIKFDLLNPISYAVLGLALSLILFSLFTSRMPVMLKRFVLVIALGYVLNAGISATLSTVTDRYQARVSWLVVFAGAMCVPYLRKVEQTS